MGSTTKIGWADATWNPIGGCSLASPGCTNCYAQTIAGSARLINHPLYKGVTTPSKAGPVFNGKLTVAPDDHPLWKWPVTWRGSKSSKAGPGQPSMIFVGDMSDLFHEDRPTAVIDKVIASLIYSPHISQLLTKRADLMRAYFTELKKSGRWLYFPHPLFGKSNFDPAVAEYDIVFLRLWLGTSCEDQRRADERIPELLATPAHIRFISYEPALGPIDFTKWLWGRAEPCPGCSRDADCDCGHLPRHMLGEEPDLGWCICGGESGEDFRPMQMEWAESAAKQFKDVGTAFFFKQDNGPRSGAKGRASPELWGRKEFPLGPSPGEMAAGLIHEPGTNGVLI